MEDDIGDVVTTYMMGTTSDQELVDENGIRACQVGEAVLAFASFGIPIVGPFIGLYLLSDSATRVVNAVKNDTSKPSGIVGSLRSLL
jgi:hypothetical protein